MGAHGGVRISANDPFVRSYRGTVLKHSPQAYWRMGDPGNTILDQTLSGWNATKTSGTVNPSGAILYDDDGCLQNGAASVSSSIPLLTHTLSAEWWFKGSQDPSTQFWGVGLARMSFGNSGWNPDVRGIGSNASIGVRIDTSAETNRVVSIPRSSANVWDNSWHHIVLILDNGILQWYVDGILRVDSTYQVGEGFLNSTSGISIRGSNVSIVPIIEQDEVAIYEYVLSPEQIADHYSVGVTGR
jgi:hypothetical protein